MPVSEKQHSVGGFDFLYCLYIVYRQNLKLFQQNHESDEMAVQSNGEASRQQLRYPISAKNKNPQHPSDSPIVRAQLALHLIFPLVFTLLTKAIKQNNQLTN